MKLYSFLLAGLMALTMTGCSGSEGSSSEPQLVAAFGEDNVVMEIYFDQEAYTHQTVIGTKVILANRGEKTIAYLKGSGSNLCPDALAYSLGELAPMFRPAIMTMDYRVEVLEPGETLELELNFAPCIPKDPNQPIGNDKELEFFQSEDFTPAPTGKVEGIAEFTYKIIPETAQADQLLADFETLPPQVLTAKIETEIK